MIETCVILNFVMTGAYLGSIDCGSGREYRTAMATQVVLQIGDVGFATHSSSVVVVAVPKSQRMENTPGTVISVGQRGGQEMWNGSRAHRRNVEAKHMHMLAPKPEDAIATTAVHTNYYHFVRWSSTIAFEPIIVIWTYISFEKSSKGTPNTTRNAHINL